MKRNPPSGFDRAHEDNELEGARKGLRALVGHVQAPDEQVPELWRCHVQQQELELGQPRRRPRKKPGQGLLLAVGEGVVQGAKGALPRPDPRGVRREEGRI